MTFDTEIAFYKANRKEFVKQYENKFLVIKGEALLGVYDTRSQAHDATLLSHEAGSFIIERPTNIIRN
ncbi:hypothetical protein [Polluticoccus soli]|uniref:hypothetical protein n=1 Tax=Polluticoccus soli TaxID=3034150 RepID=UPI0023E109A8|nr:hypothetical protein [Flavipsychrobacter sp. JY13-12]